MKQKEKEFIEFKNTYVNPNGRSEGKIRNSFGVLHYYKYYVKQCKELKRPYIHRLVYFKILRFIGDKLRDYLALGNEMLLPKKLGKIYLVKTDIKVWENNGKYYTNRGIDWNKTLRLWFEDEESRKNKEVIYCNSRVKYSFKYIRSYYVKNLSYYLFEFNRKLKRTCAKNVKKYKIIDSFCDDNPIHHYS